jgi:hypothetical protein
VANLLSGASIISQKVISAGISPGAASATYAATQVTNLQRGQIANVGIGAAFSLIGGTPLSTVGASALQSLTGLGVALGPVLGGLRGTKPVPLHTERAGSAASGTRPYSFTQDIEFFLLRADQSAPAAAALIDDKAPSVLGANVQSGGNFLGRTLSSPLGQLAAGVAVNAALGGVQKASKKNSLVAPLTGLALAAGLRASTGTGIFSQPAATAAGGSSSAVSNAVGTGPDALAQTSSLNTSSYWAPAGDYFSNLTSDSFQTPPGAFTGGSVTALSSGFAENYPNVTSDSALSDIINNEGVSPFSLPVGSLSFSGAFGSAALNEDATTIQSKDTIADIPKSWYFITAPQDVSWSKEGKVTSAETYGTNTPYVLYGSTSLRKLTLGNVLLEGFSDRKTVEANIVALETCMNMVIQAGYTAPYCWKVYSGGKSYGTFIIVGLQVKEMMRDVRGFATRAVVDIELQQVPDYQVNSGRDLASRATLGGLSSAVKGLITEQNKDSASKATSAAAGKTAANAASTGAAGKQDAAASEAKTTTPSFTGQASRVQPGGQRGTISQ